MCLRLCVCVRQESIDRLLASSWHRTTLVVAHRLATVRRAHRIIVVDGGRVVEVRFRV